MSGVNSFFIAITAVFCLQACGKTSDNDTQKLDRHQSRFPRMQATAETLQGAWESGCDVEFAENGDYRKTLYSFENGVIFKEVRIFRSTDCQSNPIWKRTYGGQYRIERGELKTSFFNLTVESQHYSQTALLNLRQSGDARFCKSQTPFETGQSLSFSPISLCNEESEQTAKIDARGENGFAQELFIGEAHLYRSRELP
jgi:hypothetical protein